MIPAAALNQSLGSLRDAVIRVKGNKAFSLQGKVTSIMDLATQDLTLVDPEQRWSFRCGPPSRVKPNAPLMQMNQEVVEVFDGSLDDALFEVPNDYQPASLEQILKGEVSAARLPQFKP